MMVYQHHERLDGIGYPLHATSREIHPWAKLCAVADVFDAITSQRAYRGPKSCSEALAVLEVGAGSAFDAEFVHCLSSVMQSR
jgi:HD-GYP domain-containing protein (c-di-GMP phosphodiesterase class II)